MNEGFFFCVILNVISRGMKKPADVQWFLGVWVWVFCLVGFCFGLLPQAGYK